MNANSSDIENPFPLSPEVRAALKKLPEAVQRLACEFPPGAVFCLAGREVTYHLLGFGDNAQDLMISPVNPRGGNLTAAIAASFSVPVSVVRNAQVKQ
jgi:hypothetical protein